MRPDAGRRDVDLEAIETQAGGLQHNQKFVPQGILVANVQSCAPQRPQALVARREPVHPFSGIPEKGS